MLYNSGPFLIVLEITRAFVYIKMPESNHWQLDFWNSIEEIYNSALLIFLETDLVIFAVYFHLQRYCILQNDSPFLLSKVTKWWAFLKIQICQILPFFSENSFNLDSLPSLIWILCHHLSVITYLRFKPFSDNSLFLHKHKAKIFFIVK